MKKTWGNGLAKLFLEIAPGKKFSKTTAGEKAPEKIFLENTKKYSGEKVQKKIPEKIN